MEITLDNDEILLEKLCKLKCRQGCQNAANYIVFEMGMLSRLCRAFLYHLFGQIAGFTSGSLHHSIEPIEDYSGFGRYLQEEHEDRQQFACFKGIG